LAIAVFITSVINTTNTTTTATNLYTILIMIEKLIIRNYLIIKEAEIDFSEKLNILTGETGAGKSIILDALSLILGDRADYSLIKKDQEKLVVEGYINFKKNKHVESLLKNLLPDEDINSGQVILRRELLKKGVSRSFINDTPVNISDLKKFGDLIVDIHSQSEHQSLLHKETHIVILDNFVNKGEIFSKYAFALKGLKDLIETYKKVFSKRDELKEKKDFLTFQMKEINNLYLKIDEDIKLENELNKLENIEDISLALNASVKGLYEDEFNAMSAISISIKELKKVSAYDKSFEKIIEDLENSYILIKESSESLTSYQSELNFDNHRIDQIRDRLSSINHLKKKYNLSVGELIGKADETEKELNFADNFDHEIDQLLNKINSQKDSVVIIAKSISEIRVKKAKELEKSINSVLKEVGLESAEFEVEIKNNAGNPDEMLSYNSGKENYKLGNSGFNEIEFLIKINKGAEFSPLRISASGGEISRIMLAIKTVLSEKDNVPVLVFDEIDTGISGRIAQKVGKILKILAETHQIICITHLPQIAAMSDKHFHVSKKDENKETIANIRDLTSEEKIVAVAKLISGEKVTEAARNSARELINS